MEKVDCVVNGWRSLDSVESSTICIDTMRDEKLKFPFKRDTPTGRQAKKQHSNKRTTSPKPTWPALCSPTPPPL